MARRIRRGSRAEMWKELVRRRVRERLVTEAFQCRTLKRNWVPVVPCEQSARRASSQAESTAEESAENGGAEDDGEGSVSSEGWNTLPSYYHEDKQCRECAYEVQALALPAPSSLS